MKNYAIIVAGGTGSRMKTEIPKQFLLLNGLPVAMHTINAFYNSSLKPQILLVLNKSFHAYWEALCITHQFKLPHTLIAGGEQRFDSVRNAIESITEEGVIAIHDAVRPIVSDELIMRCFEGAITHGNAIPVIGSRDSLRQKQGTSTIAINREEIVIVQTPQVFKSDVLKEAYKQPFDIHFTDDASAVEKAGKTIHTVEGDFKNIKITFPEDLEVAGLFLKKRA